MRKRKLARWTVLTALIAFVGGTAFLMTGPEWLWERLGSADLGDVDFATLERRSTPNDALACLPQFCAAKADVNAPVVARPQPDVFRSVQAALAKEPDLEKVAEDEGRGTLRYVQRSRLMRFPDTINLKLVPTPDGGTAVLIYSRSQIGKGDMGVNLARVKRWIGLIKAH